MSMQTSKDKKDKKLKKTCNYCKKIGHLEKDCYSKKSKSISNSKAIDLEESSKLETALVSSKITTVNKSNNTINFILDSSATIHTCCIKELFTSI
jgi:hypothetical protein